MLTMAILKGPSGTGKGTRVSQLIEFLKTKEKPIPFYYSMISKSSMGLLFKESGILFIGSYVCSNKGGLSSWSSLDSVHAAVKTASNGRLVVLEAIDFARQHSKENICIVMEGEPMLLSDKFRPEFLSKTYQPNHLMISYFTYSSRDEYEARIQGRSGIPGGDSGWGRADGYPKDFEKSKEEAVLLDDTQCHLSMRSFDETYWKWGADLLTLLGKPVDEYSAWSKNNPMLRELGKSNPMNKSKRLW